MNKRKEMKALLNEEMTMSRWFLSHYPADYTVEQSI